ncbi:saccharopine dehydrogenase NADP-binding domain-containing protein [Bradyrhizobium neotropicale]|uniref:saccharopine dehydrogenase NADP-binding domain-containing protein n=1 Tax=Bradyrhizobium neotropicale TaxID=1497615 RepID=UPI001AD7C40D|nr:saccharopine dehydrogenase NADP-binding domain-containing protein [Bradyrhizobium neotropicale]MBO4220853.1 NAD(P)H-binding protein [Bradyrhizobium neotropicale]
MSKTAVAAIYGATGHTAQLIARDLHRRGMQARLGARRAANAESASALGYEFVVFDLSNEAALTSFLEGVEVLVNCAGPFGGTAHVLAGAAVQRGIHYVDITGEPPVVEDLCKELHDTAVAANSYIIPATGFFGALPDLLATAALAAVPDAERVKIAYYLSSWRMTRGSGLAAAGLRARQFSYEQGELIRTEGPPVMSRHSFPAPVGDVTVIDHYPAPEIILLPRHLGVQEVRAVMSAATFANSASGGEGFDGADFLIEIEVAGATARKLAVATGRDIYGVTAPIVGETVGRLLRLQTRGGGVVTPAEIFPASEFLGAIAGWFTSLQIARNSIRSE